MTAYVATWAEEHGSLHVLGVYASAEAAFAAVERYRRRRRRVEWAGLWAWWRRRDDRGWPEKAHQVSRWAESPPGWPGERRHEIFGVERHGGDA